jgi:small-conductance mechanosensitive channel
MEIFGIRLVGVNAENGIHLLITLAFIAALVVIHRILKAIISRLFCRRDHFKIRFWTNQAASVFVIVVLIVGLLSIWFEDPARLTTAIGLVTAGLAFALQKVTSIAGYVVILRGNTFNVGDRITMGGVGGDVLALGFIQTTIMEMGQPPSMSENDPAVWVKSRQYTGHIVTITNDKVFTEPIHNFTRDFPYIWRRCTFRFHIIQIVTALKKICYRQFVNIHCTSVMLHTNTWINFDGII